jgi:hypothetical protein
MKCTWKLDVPYGIPLGLHGLWYIQIILYEQWSFLQSCISISIPDGTNTRALLGLIKLNDVLHSGVYDGTWHAVDQVHTTLPDAPLCARWRMQDAATTKHPLHVWLWSSERRTCRWWNNNYAMRVCCLRRSFSVQRFFPKTSTVPQLPKKFHAFRGNRRFIALSIVDQHYALIIAPLFDTQAPTCFGIHVPSSGSFLCPCELLDGRIGYVVCHVLWILVACVHWLL